MNKFLECAQVGEVIWTATWCKCPSPKILRAPCDSGKNSTSADIWVSAVLPSDFPCLSIPSFPQPSIYLVELLELCQRKRWGHFFMAHQPKHWNMQSLTALLPFFLSYLVLIGIRRSQHAGTIFFFVSKLPHRRFYSSLLVTLPALPFCSSPVARLLCGSKENLLESLHSVTDLECFFSNSLTQKKNLFVYLRWLFPVKQQKMMLRKKPCYQLEMHQIHTKMFFTKCFRSCSYFLKIQIKS